MDRRRFIKWLLASGASLVATYALYNWTVGRSEKEGETERFKITVLASELVIPWSIIPLGDDTYIVSERPGRILLVSNGDKRLMGTFDVAGIGEAGLLGLAKHPEYPSEPLIYAYMTYSEGGLMYNRVVRIRVDTKTFKLGSTEVVLDKIPGARIHDGGRIRFGPDGMLYVTAGDAASPKFSQSLDTFAGKILRIEGDGSIPDDNPFPGSPIYSYGHRNPQGIDWHPSTRAMISSEHGPVGHDEINLIVKGGNYGWPERTGSQGGGNGKFIPPLIDFGEVSVAPSGISFVRGDMFGDFRGDLLVACLRGERLIRIRFDPDFKVSEREDLFLQKFGRIRDVVIDYDGSIVICTSNRDGRGTVRAGDDKLIKIST